MNKIAILLSCVTASSFLCASERSQSPRKLTISELPRKSSNPTKMNKPQLPQDIKGSEPFQPLITRTRKHSLETPQFMDEENARKIFGKDRSENS